MSQWIPINEDMPTLGWAKKPTYIETALDTLVPLVLDELARATKDQMLVFVHNEETDQFHLRGLQSLQPGANVYVDSTGHWLGSHVPKFYQALPFALVPVDDNNISVYIDQASPNVNQPPQAGDHELFNAEGEFSQAFYQKLNFLQNYQTQLEATQARVDLLAANGLIQPWQFSMDLFKDDKPLRIEGLYRISESRLRELAPEKLAELVREGALALAYMQTLSLARVEELAGFYILSDQAKAEMQHRQTAAKKAELNLSDSLGSDEGDLFKF